MSESGAAAGSAGPVGGLDALVDDAVSRMARDPFRVEQTKARPKLAKAALELLAKTEDEDGYGSELHTIAGIAAWAALGAAGREQLSQLMDTGPVYDGDVISKSYRDMLLDLGLAVRCCFKGEQGHTAASYRAYTVRQLGREGGC